MANTKTTIELNGQLYDAATGKLLAGQVNLKRPLGRPKQVITSVNMDGFFRASPTPSHQASSATHKHSRPAAVQAVQRKPEKAKTLMRHIVKKPTTQPTASLTKNRQPVLQTNPTHHSKSAWLQPKHVSQVAKSPLVQRFARGTSSFSRKTMPLEVKPAPAHAHGQMTIIANEAPPVFIEPVRPKTTAHHRAQNSFAAALNAATSHEAKTLPKSRLSGRAARRLGVSTKLLGFSSATLAVIFLTGFIAYQNVPNFAMRIAASQAGFHAVMPSYRPAGFSLNGPIKSSPGLITLSFHSNSDNRSFALTQRPTNWDADSLLSNFILNRDQPYQTYQDQGKTIFIYNNSSATWIQSGVWYQIDGRSALNSDQLIRIASSI